MRETEFKKIVDFKEKMLQAGLGVYLNDIVWMPDYMPMIGVEKQMFLIEYYGVKVCRLIDSPND